jgi:hypothetical protein
MAVANYSRPVSEIFSDVVRHFTVLVRREAQLARVEMSEKIGDAAMGLGLLIGGAVLLIPALVILFQSAVAALVDAGFATVWASLIVGGIAAVIGIALLLFGAAQLRAARPVPTRTIEQLQRDAELAKQQMGINDGTTERAA